MTSLITRALLVAAVVLGIWPQLVRADATSVSGLADLTANFWVGPPDSGHLRMDTVSNRAEIGLWEQSQAVMAYFWSWKYLNDATSGQRVAAEWKWAKALAPTAADLATCGHSSLFNFASDDTAWDVGFYLAAYEVTHDPAALQAAQSSLDCAWQTWWDEQIGGGYWYNDTRDRKTSYQAVLTLDCEWFFRLTGNSVYQTRAIASEAAAANRLRRSDGLYWIFMLSDGSVPENRNRYHITPTSSVTMIVGNMSQTIAEMWLYEDTHDPVYFQRAQNTAAAILRYEVDSAGVLLNDRDGFTDGWAMAPFAHDVLPHLSLSERSAWKATLSRSALSVFTVDRRPDGTYGADWGGPATGGPWDMQGQARASMVSVSGGAVNVILAAAVAP